MADEAMRVLIEGAMQHPSALPFAAKLEAQYQARRAPPRRARLARTLRICAPLILLTLLMDWLAGENLLTLALPVRLVLAGICLVSSWLLPRARSGWQEAVLFGVPVIAMELFTELLGQLGVPRFADRYVMAAVVVPAALIATQPVPFTGAAGIAIAAALLFPLPLLVLSGPLPLADNLDMPLFTAGCMAVVLLMAHRAEIARRLAFLASLRNELQAMELSLLNAELLRLSSTDVLTGLANRRQFEFDLGRSWSDRRRGALAVALVDVDHFKAFNDAAGHAAGDACLRSVATAISGVMRQGLDKAARYGGEEFAILLPDVLPDELAGLGERLRRAVEAMALPHPGEGGQPVTISVGIAWRVPGSRGGTQESLLREADRALYAAKDAGRNRVVLASVAVGASAD